MADALVVSDLSVALAGRVVLREVTFSVPEGQFWALLGPNGGGKSTLIRALYGAVAATGNVAISGVPSTRLTPAERAQRVAVLRQEPELAFDFVVRELVTLGRHPHLSPWSPLGSHDRWVVEQAMARTETTALAERLVSSLSGGERQRVFLARALAQEPQILLLDEPTNHLDPPHQHQVLATVRQSGCTVLAALHDLNLALRYADGALLLQGGRLVAAGPIHQVLTPAAVQAIYGMATEKVAYSQGHLLVLLPEPGC